MYSGVPAVKPIVGCNAVRLASRTRRTSNVSSDGPTRPPKVRRRVWAVCSARVNRLATRLKVEVEEFRTGGELRSLRLCAALAKAEVIPEFRATLRVALVGRDACSPESATLRHSRSA